ncbi:dNA binding domain of tn916 integrase / site-specific recombinase phage integrase family multi-domain protein [Roseburia sp. CAG:182]|nr:dNA binding domain of tn916 integrase / site-specific recombinase phage integrase family multi-domain protein [Roseburia sp. CAG:182]
MKEPTQQYSDLINSLQSRIQALEDENRLLKERLDEAGVSYADIVSGDAEGVVELYDPDQGARIKKFDVTDKIASDFFMMFCRGRKDLYDLRYTNPKTGKNGYYTQYFNRWDRGCHIQKKDGVRCKDCELRAYKPVTLPLIKAHMNGTDPNGNDVVAIYPMLENNLCQLLVFDFDNHAKGAEQEDYANIDDRWKEEISPESGIRIIPMTEEVYECFKRIVENRKKPKKEPVIDGYKGFLFLDKKDMPEVALHWEKHFEWALAKHNRIYKEQLPKITPHVCRHTYCSNMAKSGMNPKTLQYLMGHSDIGVTLNTYTHLGAEDAKEELGKYAKMA